MARYKQVVKVLAAVVAGGYAALTGLGKLTYRSILYPAPRRGISRAPLGAELKQFDTSDGQRAQAVVFSPRDPEACTLVYFHGNGETIADSVPLGQVLLARGLRFVAVEYRGYGTSPGRGPTESGHYADAEAVLRGLQQTG